MTTWFTSDTHFGHRRLAELRGITPREGYQLVSEMNQTIVNSWNTHVKKGDTVYHLGDFSFQNWRDVPLQRAALNGQIHLIAGNHDKPYRKKAEFRDLFVQIVDYHELKVDSKLLEAGKIVLMHYPLQVWNKSHYGSIHLHGHSHGSCPPLGRRMDVGVDTRPGLAPWSLEEVLELLSASPPHQADHHYPHMTKVP